MRHRPAAIGYRQLTAMALLLLAFTLPVAAGSGLYINRVELSPPQVERLEQRLNTQLIPGRYWYDRRSGLWGREGMPNAGFEGGPAAYNLFRARRGYNAGTSGGHNWRGGSVIGGGGTTGFIGTDGTSVICGGGGCTYN